MKFICPIVLSESKENYILIDVREPYEYQFANIDCPNVPMAEVCDELKKSALDDPILLICKSGNRATAVANYLETEMHFSNIHVLEGGLQNWVEKVQPELILD